MLPNKFGLSLLIGERVYEVARISLPWEEFLSTHKNILLHLLYDLLKALNPCWALWRNGIPLYCYGENTWDGEEVRNDGGSEEGGSNGIGEK